MNLKFLFLLFFLNKQKNVEDSRMNALSGCLVAGLERSEGKYFMNHFNRPDPLVAGSLGQAL